MSPNPETEARQAIDAMLAEAGWLVQDMAAANIHAGLGVAIREFPLKSGHGFADYLLFVQAQAVKYSVGYPDDLPAPIRPLPFCYQSTGVETRFTNLLDPEPRSRQVFAVHRPETLAAWLAADPLPGAARPSSLRARLQALPGIPMGTGLWGNQVTAVANLEASLALGRPRALIQMATGSGKSLTAAAAVYRMVKHAKAKRVLFLVDRGNLGRQALKEFQNYTCPDTGNLFGNVHVIQQLKSNKINDSAEVVIGTIQRLYSILRDDTELAIDDEASSFDGGAPEVSEPPPVVYNAHIPPEYFDVIIIDECHRSIYSLWRQVLEYFDAFFIGLTATPAKHTFGFFNKNLVMEFGHAQAVAAGVNCDYDIYRIQTKISSDGATAEGGPFEVIGARDKLTRQVRWERQDEITALQVIYNTPSRQKLDLADLEDLAARISQAIPGAVQQARPGDYDVHPLWAAFAKLEASRVKGKGGRHLLTDLITLVRHAVGQVPDLEPFADQVGHRFDQWLERQQGSYQGEGSAFTDEQVAWLHAIRDQIASSLSMEREDFREDPFSRMGGLGKARAVFGERLEVLVDEMNRPLVA